MKRRNLISLVLAVVMVLSLVPVQVFAEGGQWGWGNWWDQTQPEMPAQQLQAHDDKSDVTVTVDAPEGALPQGTELDVQAVSLTAVQNIVDNSADVNGTVVAAVDITFLYEGTEIEPEKNVSVVLGSDVISNTVNATVVHLDASAAEVENGNADVEVMSAGNDANGVSFASDDFSVYAVIGGNSGTNLLTVEFYDGDTLINKQAIRLSMLDQYEQQGLDYVFDPGVPTITATQSFEGWAMGTGAYTEETKGYNVAEINDYIEEHYTKTSASDTLKFKAKVFDVFYVIYHDQAGAVLKTQAVHMTSGSTSVDVDIDYSYVAFKGEQNFTGWTKDIVTPGDYPVYAANPTVYQSPSTQSLSETIDLYPMVETGYWLSFDNNIDKTVDATSADYISPKFVADGKNTVKPADPTRTGYTFGGWYTDKNLTTAFTWGQTLSADTTVYAKWMPAQTTYRVVYWQQKATDAVGTADSAKQYDYYGMSEPRSATTGQTVMLTSADKNNSTMGFFFTYNSTNSEQYEVVKGDGSTVLNVYYDRKTITITFKQSNATNSKTLDVKTGLYGAPIQDWPDPAAYEIGSVWKISYNGGTYTMSTEWKKFVHPFGENIAEVSWVHFLGSHDYSGAANVYWLFETDSGTFEKSESLMKDSKITGTLDIATNLMVGYTFYGYNQYGNSTTDSHFVKRATNAASTSVQTNASNHDLYLYFQKNKHPLTFNYNMEGQTKVVTVPYGVSLSSYKTETPATAPAGYYFDGWYADPALDTPFDFDNTKMPDSGVMVYAKWTKMKFRVVLDPTGLGEGNTLPDIEFPGTTQATTFRLDYGELIQSSAINAVTRPGYNLLGWYLDTDPTNDTKYDTLFNFNAALTEEDADMTYATSSNRSGRDPWNNNQPYNDGNGEHEDVRGKIVLYARWREDPKGAIGVHVQYDAMEGKINVEGKPQTWKDPQTYADLAEAFGQPASTPNNNDLQFLYWEIMKPTSATDSTLVSTGKKVYPGQIWEVSVADAVKTEAAEGNSTGSATRMSGNINPVKADTVTYEEVSGTTLEAGEQYLITVEFDSETLVLTNTVNHYNYPALSEVDVDGNTIESGALGDYLFTVGGDDSGWTFYNDSVGYFVMSGYYTAFSSGDAGDYAKWLYDGTLENVGASQWKWLVGYTSSAYGYYFETAKARADAGIITFYKPTNSTPPAPTTGKLTINYVMADGTTAPGAYTADINIGETYSVTSPTVEGYTPDQAVITGTMTADGATYTVTYTKNAPAVTHTLTVNYVGPEGDSNFSAPATHTSSVAEGSTYRVVSPAVDGYTPDKAIVSGTMGNSDVTVTVTYAKDVSTDYTVYLHAVYGRSNKTAKTHITWYANNDGVTAGTVVQRDTELDINGAINIPTPTSIYNGTVDHTKNDTLTPTTLTYDDHVFLGWARVETTAGDVTGKAHPELNEDDLYLEWIADTSAAGGHYVVNGNVTAAKVAADEMQPYQDMYAVWGKVFYVYHTSTGTVERRVICSTTTKDAEGNSIERTAMTADLTKMVADGSLYGGYYKKYDGKNDTYGETLFTSEVAASATELVTPATKNDTGAKKYDGANVDWDWDDSYNADNGDAKGNAVVPEAGKTYYIKEVPASKYLLHYTHYTYKLGVTDGVTDKITKMWMISDIDDGNYQGAGFVYFDENHMAKVVTTLTIKTTGTTPKDPDVLSAVSLFGKTSEFGRDKGVTRGYLTYCAIKDELEGKTQIADIQNFWITPDNMMVTGVDSRTLTGIGSKTTLQSGTLQNVGSTVTPYTPAGNTNP